MCEKNKNFEFWWEIGYFGHFMKGLKCIKKKVKILVWENFFFVCQ